MLPITLFNVFGAFDFILSSYYHYKYVIAHVRMRSSIDLSSWFVVKGGNHGNNDYNGDNGSFSRNTRAYIMCT